MNKKKIEEDVLMLVKHINDMQDSRFFKWDRNVENIFICGVYDGKLFTLKMYEGITDTVELEPRDVIYDLLHHIKTDPGKIKETIGELDYYILHNHTSGDVSPSDNDYKAANLSKLIFGLLNISLVACAVFDKNDYAVINSKEQEYLCDEAEKLICQF